MLIHVGFLNKNTVLLRSSCFTFSDMGLLEKVGLSGIKRKEERGNINGIFRSQVKNELLFCYFLCNQPR